ncbi:MAG: tyrosine-type recombinase/integrase [bacterium]
MSNIVYETLNAQKIVSKSDYVFANTNGKPYTDIKRSLKTALKKAKITKFRFHDCRHTYALQLAMATHDIRAVQILLRHSDSRYTERYAHLADSYLREAVQKLEDVTLGVRK